MELKVLIADDDAGMRLVLRKLIDSMEGFTLVGETGNGEETVRLCGELNPDVVFIDVKCLFSRETRPLKQIAATTRYSNYVHYTQRIHARCL